VTRQLYNVPSISTDIYPMNFSSGQIVSVNIYPSVEYNLPQVYILSAILSTHIGLDHYHAIDIGINYLYYWLSWWQGTNSLWIVIHISKQQLGMYSKYTILIEMVIIHKMFIKCYLIYNHSIRETDLFEFCILRYRLEIKYISNFQMNKILQKYLIM
jgi:hypothetical protein